MSETVSFSAFYHYAVTAMDFVMRIFWALSLSLLYGHFFRMKRMERAKWMAVVPAALWFLCEQAIHIFVSTDAFVADNVMMMFQLALLYGSLFLISLVFYRGTISQLGLITMFFAAVSESGRFLAFSLSYFWSRIYECSSRWFENNYPAVTIRDFTSLVEKLAIIQQFTMYLLFLGVLYGTVRYLRKIYTGRELPLHRTEFLFLMIPCTSSFLLCTLLRTIMITTEDAMPKTLYETFPILIFIVPFLLILCLFAMLYSIKSYQEMRTLYEERNRRVVLEKQIVSMEEHTRELERVYSGVRAMKHDMKNQLAVLGSLIQREENTDTINSFIEQLNRTMGKLDLPFQTGSAVVDSLLSMKYHEACEKAPDIRFEAEGLFFSEKNSIQPADLCIILGNALDNAIEACKKAADSGGKDCFIRLSSVCRQNMLLITVENSYSGELSVTQGSVFPITTKSDSLAHGIGMHNIKAAAERYQGGVSWSGEKNVFSLTVMLRL